MVTRNRYEPLNSEVLENSKSMGAPGGDDKSSETVEIAGSRLSNSAVRHGSPENRGTRKFKENRSVLVVGDSMLKHLTQQKISKSTNTRVRVKSFLGAAVRDMKDHIKPGLRTNPENVILHIGTNDIRHKEAPE